MPPGRPLCIICEYCEGGTLNDQLRERRRQKRAMCEGDALELFSHLSLAIDHMHHHRVIHRDLKPENVLVSRRGLLKVGDFGLSRQLSSAHGAASTRCGTPFYMAPEIVCAEPSGRAADMWALGVILYEMLTMRRPFQGDNLVQMAVSIARADYPALPAPRYSEQVRRLVSERLLVVVQHARAKIGDVLCSEPVGRALATHLERVGDDASAGNGGGGGGLPDAWTAGLLLPLTRRRTVHAPRMVGPARVREGEGAGGGGGGGGGGVGGGVASGHGEEEGGGGEKTYEDGVVSDVGGREEAESALMPRKPGPDEPSAPPMPSIILQPPPPDRPVTATAPPFIDDNDEDEFGGERPVSAARHITVNMEESGAETLSVTELAKKLKTILKSGEEDGRRGVSGMIKAAGDGHACNNLADGGGGGDGRESKVVRAARNRKNTVAVVNRVIAEACSSDAAEETRRYNEGLGGGDKNPTALNPPGGGAGGADTSPSPAGHSRVISRLIKSNSKKKKTVIKTTTTGEATTKNTTISSGDVLGNCEGAGAAWGRGGAGGRGGGMSVVIEEDEGELEEVVEEEEEEEEELRSSVGLHNWILRNDDGDDTDGSEFDF